MIRKCAFGQDAQASTEHERFMQSVDRFVMTVTENLCRLEKENAEFEQRCDFPEPESPHSERVGPSRPAVGLSSREQPREVA